MKNLFLILVAIFFHLKIFAQPVDHYLDSLKSVYHGKALFEKFQKYKKSQGLITGLKDEIGLIKNDTVRQTAIIAIFHNLYGYKWVEDGELVKWIDSVAENSLNADIKRLALHTKTYFVDGIIGQQLDTINLPDHLGDSISTLRFKGKYLVVDLWATWCGPCVQEMKRIPATRRKFDNLEFYSISFDNEYEKMQKFVRKKGYEWPIVFAGKDHPLWKYFRVSALPNYFIVDPKGKIVANTIHELDVMIEKHVGKPR